jgi:undecaprenyl diphosphate synthase
VKITEKAARPRHVAIIPDGNRRWGELNGVEKNEAYRTGIRKIRKAMGWCREEGIRNLTMWGFSTENFSRDSGEISTLFRLFETELLDLLSGNELTSNDVSVRFFGKIRRLPEGVCKMLRKVEEVSSGGKEYSLNILLGYGGRAEITDAVNSIISEGISKVDEETLSSHMYMKGVPDPDLIIRTSGEKRLSGFLPWQSVYSELYFSEKLWPDFSREDFGDALDFYEKTQRRFGK